MIFLKNILKNSNLKWDIGVYFRQVVVCVYVDKMWFMGVY